MRTISETFSIWELRVKAHGFIYDTFLPSGYLRDKQIRRHFKNRE